MSTLNQTRFFSRIRFYLTTLVNSTQPSDAMLRKRYERNYLSAGFSLLSIVLLITSLFDQRWFWLNGGTCNMKYMGVNMFFPFGKAFTMKMPMLWNSSINNIYRAQSNYFHDLIGCIDTRTLVLFRLIITLICLILISSTIGFLLDIFGSMQYLLKLMRRYAFWYTVSIFLGVIITGLCFHQSELIFNLQNRTRSQIGKKVDIQFDKGYYLFVISNLVLIFSIAVSYLRNYPIHEQQDASRLINHSTISEQSFVIARSLPGHMSNIRNNEPPPDYYSDDDFLVL